jgi:hypothetical protein
MEQKEQALPVMPANRSKLFLGGDKTQHIGWVEVYNGVNVIEYTVDKTLIKNMNTLVILPIGNIFTEEAFGAFDRNKHRMPYG